MASLYHPCGTQAAYDRHRSYGQVPDEACLEANRRRVTAQRQAKRAPQEQAKMLRELLDLIAAECRRAGMLP